MPPESRYPERSSIDEAAFVDLYALTLDNEENEEEGNILDSSICSETMDVIEEIMNPESEDDDRELPEPINLFKEEELDTSWTDQNPELETLFGSESPNPEENLNTSWTDQNPESDEDELTQLFGQTMTEGNLNTSWTDQNPELEFGSESPNAVDTSLLVDEWADQYPNADLDEGFLVDDSDDETDISNSDMDEILSAISDSESTHDIDGFDSEYSSYDLDIAFNANVTDGALIAFPELPGLPGIGLFGGGVNIIGSLF